MQGEGLSSPEQFGIWEVEGVGLVVAFRGTASTEDVLVDVNIRPMPLATSKSMRGRVFKILQCAVSGRTSRNILVDAIIRPLQSGVNPKP